MKIHFKIFFALSFILTIVLLTGCPESSSPSNSNSTVKFLMGYEGDSEGPYGDKNGIVLVDSKGNHSWVSEYYPRYFSTDYIDIKNGRIAFCTDYPPEDVTPIAYMDVNNIDNVKFIPIPPSGDKDYYWSTPVVRPQVLSDGKIVFYTVWETVNPYDDFHDGRIAIYDPKTGDFDFSPSISDFILSQPEQGFDTEGGSISGNFVLSQDESFVVLNAYGYGTDAGVYHEDYHFLVKYDLSTKTFSRIIQDNPRIMFITYDNKYTIVNLYDGKYSVDVNTGDKIKIDDYNEYICVGKYSKKNYLFFKTWRGAGISLMDAKQGWLYNPILGDSLPYPYRGCGLTGQFSKDESMIYFTASTDFHTNYNSPFVLYSTKLTGSTNSKPDSLTQMDKWFDTNLLLLLY